MFAANEVRVEHEAETRRMWLPVGVRTKIHVDREKAAQSYFGALNLRSGRMHLERIEGQQNAEQMMHVLARFQRAHPDIKIAIVWDNASWHRAKELMKLFEPGQLFDNITLIRLPPYAPDHNPAEHVWNQGKGAISNLQRETPTQRAFRYLVSLKVGFCLSGSLCRYTQYRCACVSEAVCRKPVSS